MKEFWNSRYSAVDFAYGTDPNRFFAQEIEKLSPGLALFPAEGEGRNAVFAAKKGWDVSAFDISEAGKSKALKLAGSFGLEIKYELISAEDFQAEHASFDLLVLIFAHFPSHKRPFIHRNLLRFLKPGGTIILEAFSKEHLKFNAVDEKAGGPKDITMLYSKGELDSDFEGLEVLMLSEETIRLEEGAYHSGNSAVIRLVARKPK